MRAARSELGAAARASVLWIACLSSSLSSAKAAQALDPFDAAITRSSSVALEAWSEQHPGELFGRVRTLLLQLLASDDAERSQHLRNQVEFALGAANPLDPTQRFARTVLEWRAEQQQAFRALWNEAESARAACVDGDLVEAWLAVSPVLDRDPVVLALLNRPLCQVAKAMANTGTSENLRRLVEILDTTASAWGDRPWIAWYGEWQGQLAWARGDLVAAVRHLERSIATSEGLGHDDAVSHTLSVLSLVRSEAGDPHQGLADATRAEELARCVGDTNLIREGVHARAANLYDLGEIEAALELLAAVEETGRSRDATQLRLDLLRATALQDSGRLESALAWIESALELSEDASVLAQAPSLRGDALLAAGLVYGDLGQHDRGLEALERARRFFVDAGEPRGVAWARKNSGWILLERGSPALALGEFSEALEYAEADGKPFLEGWCALGCAESSQRFDPDSARIPAWLDEAERCAARIHDLYLLARVASARGLRAVARGDDRAALQQFESAVDATEALRARFSLPGLLTHFLRDKVDPYRQAAFVSARLGSGERALRFAELSRARVLFELRSRSDPLPVACDERLRDARRALAQAESSLRAASSESEHATRADAVAKSERDLDAALLAVELSGADIGRRSLRTEPADPAHVAAALHASRFDVLVEYVLAERETLALVIHGTKDAPRVETVVLPAGESELRARIERLRAPIDALARGELDLVHLGFDVEAARELYALLVAPLEPWLGARVAIVPDGVLWQLPFEALVTGGSVARADPRLPFAHLRALRYWIDSATISYLPSSSALGSLQLDSRARDAAAVVSKPSPEVDALRAFAPDALGELRVYDATTFDPLATDLRDVRWLHFTAHGVCDERFPGNSHLALGGGAEVAAWQIESWRLSARLVVLSACYTSSGKLAVGEGALGLTRSFLAAGAAEVIASQWAVEERSTQRLVDSLWRAIAEGAEPVDALRSAKLRLRSLDDPRGFALAHPYFWAAWVSHRGG